MKLEDALRARVEGGPRRYDRTHLTISRMRGGQEQVDADLWVEKNKRGERRFWMKYFTSGCQDFKILGLIGDGLR